MCISVQQQQAKDNDDDKFFLGMPKEYNAGN